MVPSTPLPRGFFTSSQKHASFTQILLPRKQMHDDHPLTYRQSGAMTDMAWKRISGRRYVAHFSLCVLAVYISSLTTQTPFPTAIIWGSAPYISLIFSFATQFGPPGIPTSQVYCSITALMLLYLDKAAIALGKAAEPSFDDTGLQHYAVHFALAFFVLSEFEYRRQYIVTKGIEHFRNYSWDLLLADLDSTFSVSRSPSQYWQWYATTCNKGRESIAERYRISFVMVLDIILFALIGGCFNYGIMLMVNQSHTPDYDFLFATANVNVLFKTTNLWIGQLGFWVLSRFVRQGNFIAIRGLLRASARALDWWSSNGTSLSNIRYLSTRDVENGYCLHPPSKTGKEV